MRWIIVILLCISLCSCSSIIVIKEFDKMGNVVRSYEATDYNFRATPSGGITAAPDRWLTKETAAGIMAGGKDLMDLIMELLKRIPAVMP